MSDRQPPAVSGPIPTDARRNIDEPFDLPDKLAEVLDSQLQAEQWLHEQGIRELVTAIGSADTSEFLRGVKNLQKLFVTRFADGYAAGRQYTRHVSALTFVAGAGAASLLWALGVWLTTL